jgi:signal transduction histidine kinase
LWVWLPIIATTAMHYATGSEQHGAHGVLRRVYYLPIIVAALQHGLRGGLVASAVTSVAYLPHAFSDVGHHDPAPWLEKALEIALYNVVGAVAGYLTSQERARREQLQAAYDEQQALQDQLVRAGRLAALGEVVAGVAHEVRNPLHALQGSAERIDREVTSETGRRMWELHLRELDRLERVADRFLSFARPAEPALASVDLRDPIERTLELVGAEARGANVRIEWERPAAPIRANADAEQLVQVLLNLALNAVRATSHDTGTGRVAIELTEGAGGSVVSVENDGPPIPAEDHERIFDPFFTTVPSGSGLGLSISARIVEQHGGRLDVADGDSGPRFSVWLPSAPAP